MPQLAGSLDHYWGYFPPGYFGQIVDRALNCALNLCTLETTEAPLIQYDDGHENFIMVQELCGVPAVHELDLE